MAELIELRDSLSRKTHLVPNQAIVRGFSVTAVCGRRLDTLNRFRADTGLMCQRCVAIENSTTRGGN